MGIVVKKFRDLNILDTQLIMMVGWTIIVDIDIN